MRHGIAWAVMTLAVGMSGGLAERGEAAWFDSLVLPGDVVASHATIERRCDRCHEPFKKESQDRLCVDCHRDVQADRDRRTGYHGHTAAAQEQPCKVCHSDHLGRLADIVGLVPKTFDHQLTDLPLRGGHGHVECPACHRPTQRYREAPHRCIECHGAHDPHQKSLGEGCERCHDEAAWKTVRFDHATAAFALEGGHRNVGCERCHPTQRYRPTATTCDSCHARDDKHQGRFGAKCETCHSVHGWKLARFDHARATKFPLLDRHLQVSCEACHKGTAAARLPITCIGCHAAEDAHKGRFESACETCHAATEWRRHTFDHTRATRFPLQGRHTGVACTVCHQGALYAEHLDVACYSCHRDDDTHHGQEGTRCESCHDARSWTREVFFDHDLAGFPLLGKHATVPCESCHTSKLFKDARRDCLSCHAKVDAHGRRLGTRCGDCHNPSGWREWEFDHDARTAFGLDGAHTRVACEACHRKPIEEGIALSPRCVSCHDVDDVHRGQFGPQCERCHETSSFRMVRLQ